MQCVSSYNSLLDKFIEKANSDKLVEYIERCKIDCAIDRPETWVGEDITRVDIEDRCYRVGRKRSKYYTHVYDPSWLPKSFAESGVFDMERRDKCCKCISIVLYIKSPDYLSKVITLMEQSVRNVDLLLPDFVVKYYLDSSVFTTLADLVTDNISSASLIIDMLSNIISHPKSEIYIYFCKSVLLDGVPIERVRTFRFMPMIEKDVAFYAIREADAVVTAMDCHNLSKFQSEQKIFMLYMLNGMTTVSLTRDVTIAHYSEWLNLYEAAIRNPNYKYNYLHADGKISTHVIDILAGCISSGIRFNVAYFNRCVKIVNYYITTKMHEHRPIVSDSLDSDTRDESEIFEDDMRDVSDKAENKRRKKKLHVIFASYDEVLLMELYKILRVSSPAERAMVNDLIICLTFNPAIRSRDKTEYIRGMFISDITDSKYASLISKLDSEIAKEPYAYGPEYTKPHLCEYLLDYMLFRYKIKSDDYIGNVSSLINKPFAPAVRDLLYKDIECIDAYNSLLDMFINNTNSRSLESYMLTHKISCGDAELDPWMGQDVSRVDINDRCYLIGHKKLQYYIHKYDPSWIEDLVPGAEVLGLDLQTRYRCCKCISMVLYGEKYSYISDAIMKTEATVRNVDRWLPEFIIKFYIDNSVFDLIAEQVRAGDQRAIEVIEQLVAITSHPKVETYMYFCKDRYAGPDTYRHLPMKEPDVAFYAIRDAHTTISIVDLYNISRFQSDTNYLFMCYDIYKVTNGRHKYAHMNMYEDALNDPKYRYNLVAQYGQQYMPIIDVYPGCLTSGFMFTKEHFDRSVKMLNAYYRSSSARGGYEQLLMMTLLINFRAPDIDDTEYVEGMTSLFLTPSVLPSDFVKDVFNSKALDKVDSMGLVKYVETKGRDVEYIALV